MATVATAASAASVVVVRVHVGSVRRPRQAIRRRQCAPFSRLLYVFPPLLRILCRNKFFLRRIKILEGHSEYLARCGDIDVPRWEQNGCAASRPDSSSSIVRIGLAVSNPLFSTLAWPRPRPLSARLLSARHSSRVSEKRRARTARGRE